MRIRIMCLLIAIIISIATLSGCGTRAVSPEVKENMSVVEKQTSDSSTNGVAVSSDGNLSQDITNSILSERKIIRSANISIEVENF